MSDVSSPLERIAIALAAPISPANDQTGGQLANLVTAVQEMTAAIQANTQAMYELSLSIQKVKQ